MNIINKLKNKFNEMFPNENEPPAKTKADTLQIRMPDGSLEEYDLHFMITDGINCVVCMGKYYHTSLDCESLKWEHMNCDSEYKGMTIKAAKDLKMIYCYDCSRENYLHRHGRDDEI